MELDVRQNQARALLAKHCAEYMKRVVFLRAYFAKKFLQNTGKYQDRIA